MSLYLKTALCMEEWYSVFLSYIKTFLHQQGLYDLTPSQMILIYHMKEEPISMGEVAWGSFFWGTNPHYNLTKLIRLGYLSRHRNPRDHRICLVSLNEKGRELRTLFQTFLEGEFLQKEGQKKKVFSTEFLESLYALFSS